MNVDVKRRWLEALRSGRYRQGRHRLHRAGHRATHSPTGKRQDPEFCCLGVLCELATEDGVLRRTLVPGAFNDSEREYYYADATGDDAPGYSGSTIKLPRAVLDWADLRRRDPIVDGVELSKWNDSYGANFRKIADLVEEHL